MDSKAFLTDMYELTMLDAAFTSGKALTQARFDVFTRRLDNRRFGVFGGLGRVLDALDEFTFTKEMLDWLAANQIVSQATCNWLENFSFTGTIDAYREGEVFFANSPVMSVSGTFAECVLLETLILSITNFDSAVASAAARMKLVAGDTPTIDMGSRRGHEQAGVAAARAAYIAGFDATSNLQAGFEYNIPTVGTAAHAFTLVHKTEREAFQAQVATLGVGTTLLVDTYDVAEGVRTAVEVAGPSLGAVRIDSGDLRDTAFMVRDILDSLGATETRIVATSDLDEFRMSRLEDAPIDGFGVGTRLITGSGTPTMGFVYKLVERQDETGRMVPVEKKSEAKATVGGRKFPFRTPFAETISLRENWTPPEGRRLFHTPVVDGIVVEPVDLMDARQTLRDALKDFDPDALLMLSGATPLLPTRYGPR